MAAARAEAWSYRGTPVDRSPAVPGTGSSPPGCSTSRTVWTFRSSSGWSASSTASRRWCPGRR